MSRQLALKLIDTHAGGDVSRIVTGGVAALPGATVRAQMEYLRDEADGLRRLLLKEPYGIPEMSVDLIVPASDPQAVAGYIIMEVMGYPVYSGSNTICTATALLDAGFVEKREGRQRFTLQAPAGPVQILARVEDDVVKAVTCEGLPSYIDTYRTSVHVPVIGDVTYTIAYSGGFYALVDAAELGFELKLHEEQQLARCAQAIVETILAEHGFSHYSLGDVGPLPFLHFMGPIERLEAGRYRSRSATYVHPGIICRSTTGTGTSARLALMQYEQAIDIGDTLETVSLRGTRFIGKFLGTQVVGNHTITQNTITGQGHVLAHSEIIVNNDDELVDYNGLQSVLSRR